MSYRAAIESLRAMAPELHSKPNQPRRKFSLDEFRALMAALGNPQNQFRSVLIAGTNGKGSTASTLASITDNSGVRTGLYTSPHLERVNERIRIGVEEIGDEDFGRLFFCVYETAEGLVREGDLPQLPSFFEILTAQAMLYFAERKVGLAVLEVGMGGRLDATNVVEPLVSVITDISLDHTEWLGSTVAAITREKAGILRRRGTLITLPQDQGVNAVLGKIASELSVTVVKASGFVPRSDVPASGFYTVVGLGDRIEVQSPLSGVHQQRNVALAISASIELAEVHGFTISAASISEGIRKTYWPGRLERLHFGGVDWILDVAHNPAGAIALRNGLNEFRGVGHPRILIFSCLLDKPLKELARILFPLFDEVIFAPIHSSRGMAMEELEAAGREMSVTTESAKSVGEALRRARDRAMNGAVVISGSVYLVGEARPYLMGGGIE